MQEVINELGIASARAQFLKSSITSYQKLRENPDQRIYLIRDEVEGELNLDPENVYYSHSTAKENLINFEGEKISSLLTTAPEKAFHEYLDELRGTTFHNAQAVRMASILPTFPGNSNPNSSTNLPGLVSRSEEHELRNSNQVYSHAKSIPLERRIVHGFIKVGPKKLFVTDELGRQHEIYPLCVLDFYVFEKSQRKGYGKRIFDHMLSMEGILPSKLAYDRPSNKLLGFLKKHYNLCAYVSQANNFVIFRDYGLSYLPTSGSRSKYQTGAYLRNFGGNGLKFGTRTNLGSNSNSIGDASNNDNSSSSLNLNSAQTSSNQIRTYRGFTGSSPSAIKLANEKMDGKRGVRLNSTIPAGTPRGTHPNHRTSINPSPTTQLSLPGSHHPSPGRVSMAGGMKRSSSNLYDPDSIHGIANTIMRGSFQNVAAAGSPPVIQSGTGSGSITHLPRIEPLKHKSSYSYSSQNSSGVAGTLGNPIFPSSNQRDGQPLKLALSRQV